MSVPPDILAALQGGGGQGGQIPPDMLAALGGGGAEEAGEPGGGLHSGSAAAGDPEELYRQAIDLLEQAAKADTDEARIQTALKCITSIQGELANSQKGMDSMMGGKLDQAQMRRMGSADQSY